MEDDIPDQSVQQSNTRDEPATTPPDNLGTAQSTSKTPPAAHLSIFPAAYAQNPTSTLQSDTILSNNSSSNHYEHIVPLLSIILLKYRRRLPGV